LAHATQVNLDEIVGTKDDLTGADMKAICTEAGLLALRERRMKVQMKDFEEAKEKTLKLKRGNIPDGLYI
jgi:26S proteasome regulatory subunit T2